MAIRLKQIIRQTKSHFSKLRNGLYVRFFLFKHRKLNLIWQYPHIGDMVYALLPLAALKERTQKKYTIIGNIKYKSLYMSFHAVDDLILLSERHILWFCSRSLDKYSRDLIIKKIKNEKFFSNDFEFYLDEYPFMPQETLISYTQRVIYNVHVKEYRLPDFKYCLDNLSVPNRSILISPYAKSVQQMPMEYYENLINQLKPLGYVVYTNCGIDEEAIRGTIPLRCSIAELCGLAKEKNPIFIGLRSGICDFLALTGIKMYVFYNNYHLSTISSLLQYSKQITEFYGIAYCDYINEIIQDLKANED